MRECNPVDSLSDILMDIPDLVLAFSKNGRYLFVNHAAAQFLDADPFEVIGCHWQELGYPDEIMEPVMERVAEVAVSGEPILYRFTSSASRGSRTFDMSFSPLRCDDKGVFAVLAILHDISEFFAE